MKEKRAVLRPVVEGLRRLASLSVAEVGQHDAWQRAIIGIAIVAPDPRQLDRIMDRCRSYLESCTEIEVLSIAVSHLEDPS